MKKFVKRTTEEIEEYKDTASGSYRDVSNEIRKMDLKLRKRKRKLRDIEKEICCIKIDQIVIPIRKYIYESE
jgi:hypothetical protein